MLRSDEIHCNAHNLNNFMVTYSTLHTIVLDTVLCSRYINPMIPCMTCSAPGHVSTSAHTISRLAISRFDTKRPRPNRLIASVSLGLERTPDTTRVVQNRHSRGKKNKNIVEVEDVLRRLGDDGSRCVRDIPMLVINRRADIQFGSRR